MIWCEDNRIVCSRADVLCFGDGRPVEPAASGGAIGLEGMGSVHLLGQAASFSNGDFVRPRECDETVGFSGADFVAFGCVHSLFYS